MAGYWGARPAGTPRSGFGLGLGSGNGLLRFRVRDVRIDMLGETE